VLRRLRRIRLGRLTFEEGRGRVRCGQEGDTIRPQAVVRVRDPRFFTAVALRGSIGAAEAYMDGWWTCEDLTSAIRVVIANRDALRALDGGLARLASRFRRLLHELRRNTRRGSRRNIAAHYDLGNDFFAAFLDETMAYSCGIFERADSTLHEASLAKLEAICRKLDLKPGQHLLEIGSGWGSLAIHAAERYGCRVTTITVSEKQRELAERRIREAGLADRVRVLLRDYRDLDGTYDALASIEMIEAVGERYLRTFFRACGDRLKSGGRMLLQAIVVPEERYRRYRRSVDFIQRHVFPGSFLPSLAIIREHAEEAGGMRVVAADDITAHYPRTLRSWRERFVANVDRVRALGYAEPLLRMWEYYLCYCEGGFLERWIGDYQLLLEKPGRSGSGREAAHGRDETPPEELRIPA
jgi:cyclopropane-fatty-acyl-phospholipid synthase